MSEINITENAANRIREQLAKRGKGLGLRLSVRESGCSGYAYVMDYADEQNADDLVIGAYGIKVFVDAASLPMLRGLQLDFRREGVNELFKFDNPNAQELCGCGESFTTGAPVALV